MFLAKPIPIILLASGICLSAPNRFQGVVKDSLSSQPISGVQVNLLKASEATTTDKSGAFSFASISSIREGFPKAKGLPYAERNGSLTLRLPHAAKVDIRAYALNGKPLASLSRDWNAGEYSVPSLVTATGTYFYRLRIGAAAYAFKVARLNDGRGLSGWNGPLAIASGGDAHSLGKRSAQGAATDTLWFRKEGYASKKVPVPDTALDLAVSLRPNVLANGVRPGIWSGMTDQYTAFTLYVAQDGKTLDSLTITVTMQECAKRDFVFHVNGPAAIPRNGVVSIGDSVTIAFTDSSVSGTFSTKWHTQASADPPCEDTQIYYTGGGTIIQIVPRYSQYFALGGRVPFESNLMELIVDSPHGTVKKDPDHALYFPGEKVKLTAVPETLFAVTRWTGASSVLSENEATVDMNGPRTVTLEYTPFPSLTIARTAGGGVTQVGWYYDRASGWQLIPLYGALPYQTFWHPGDTLMLVPSVKDKYVFTGWTGDVQRRSGDTAWVIMDGPKTVTPVFQIVYTLTVTGGAIQIPDKPYFKPGDNDTIMLVAQPGPLMRFGGWTGPVYRTSGDTAWVIMNSSKVVSPNYVRATIQAQFPKDGSQGNFPFSRDGSVFALGSGDSVSLWDTRTGKPIKKIKLRYSSDYFVFAPDGKRILYAAYLPDSAIALDLSTGAEAMGFPFGPYLTEIAYSPTDSLIAITGTDSLFLRSSATGAEIARIAGIPGQCKLAFSPDGTRLAVVSDSIRIVDMRAKALIKTISRFPAGAISATITGFAFSPDGSSLNLILREQRFMRIDVATGEITKNYPIDELAESAAFSPDGLQVAIGTWNRGILIRDVETGALIRDLTAGMNINLVLQVAFAPDNIHLLSRSSDDGTVTLWDTKHP